jgi:hypothetical protein
MPQRTQRATRGFALPGRSPLGVVTVKPTTGNRETS